MESNKHMEQVIEQLRVETDSLAQYTNTLTEGWIPQVTSAIDSLYFGKAWLGKLLSEFEGNESPYKNGKTEVAHIEPTASVADLNETLGTIDKEAWEAMADNRIQKVDVLRQSIGRIADRVKHLNGLPNSREASICRTQAWIYLNEARFHLGFELQRIKEATQLQQ